MLKYKSEAIAEDLFKRNRGTYSDLNKTGRRPV
jgi:hypothetical protein